MDVLSEMVIGAAIRVHRRLGPGLLESIYRACLAHEIRREGHLVEVEQPVRLHYDDLEFEVGFRLDLVVDGELPIELKACERILEVHEAQLLSYLRLGRFKRGLLINFHVPRLTQGIRRISNGWLDDPDESLRPSASSAPLR